METRHKLDEAQQQLQDRSSHVVQQEQQHSQAVARLTQDLEKEQQARSGLPSASHARTAMLILTVSLADAVHQKTSIIVLFHAHSVLWCIHGKLTADCGHALTVRACLVHSLTCMNSQCQTRQTPRCKPAVRQPSNAAPHYKHLAAILCQHRANSWVHIGGLQWQHGAGGLIAMLRRLATAKATSTSSILLCLGPSHQPIPIILQLQYMLHLC